MSLSKAISGLGDGTYRYRVRACNGGGCSGYRYSGYTAVELPPAFSVNNTSVSEGGNLTFTVTKSKVTTQTYGLSYATANGTAAAGSDYTTKSGSLSFSGSQTSKTVTVSSIEDPTHEANETLYLNLTSPTNSATISDNQGLGTINNDDAVTVSIADATGTEGGSVVFNVTLDLASSVTQTVAYSLVDNTALSGSDYTSQSGTVTFSAGQTSQVITVNTVDDAGFETIETFTANLSSPTGGVTISDGSATGTIVDDDASPTFIINSASAVEGGALTVYVNCNGDTALPQSVDFSLVNGSAQAGSDFTTQSGTLDFSNGVNLVSFTVPLTEDSVYEGNETLQLVLSNPQGGAVISQGTATGTIIENDPLPSLSISDVSAEEGNDLTFTVTKAGATALSHSVQYTTQDGSATNPDDYTTNSGTLSFAAAETSKTFTVLTGDDNETGEGDETFTVQLSAPTNGAVLANTEATGTLLDDDGIVPAAPAPYDAIGNLSSLVSQADIDLTDTVGSVGGSFRVNESGAATYSIPIATVAGTAGVVPQVSLNYSSQGGNGLMGLGWSVGGLSGISRCRQTLHQDMNPLPITWSSTDRFCLDGQRLIKVSGTYGAPNSTYKTETDSFAKVTAKGGTTGHPDYWEVERKDGSISTYGGSGNTTSEQQAWNGTSATTKVLTWAIDRFEDSVGNQIVFTYSDTVNYHRIASIRYAYGATASYGARIDFTYEGRSDDISGYVAGYNFKNTTRLKTIKSYNGSAIVRQYNLAYKATPANPANKTAKLASVQECVGTKCLPTTTFDWQEQQMGFGSAISSDLGANHSRDLGVGNFQPADINGDGLMDVVWYYNLQDGSNDVDFVLRYALSNGTKLIPSSFSVRYNDDDDGGLKFKIVDYNADGRQDVIIKDGNNGNWKVHLSTPQTNGSWALSTSTISTPISATDTVFADINSDGLVDAISQVSGNIAYRLLSVDTSKPVTSSQYYKWGSQVTLTAGLGTGINSHIVSGHADFDGDGQSDIAHIGSQNGGGYVPVMVKASLLSLHDNAVSVYDELGSYDLVSAIIGVIEGPGAYEKGNTYQVVDINGDGLTDIFTRFDVSYAADAGTTWSYRINTGTGLGDEVLFGDIPTKLRPQFVDYNKDGYTDVIWHDVSGSYLKGKLWNPETSTFSAAINIRSTNGDDEESHQFMDINGDGLLDYVRFANDTLYTYPNNAANQPINVITQVTNGLGAETDITYKPLGTSGHYDRVEVLLNQQCQTITIFNGPYEYCTTSSSGFYSALNSTWDLPSGSQTLGKPKPVLELNGPMAVVTEVNSSAPTASNINAKSGISYYYGEAKIQASGRGMLGFNKLKTVDEQTGVETITTYRQDWPFIGYPLKTEVYSAAGHKLSEAENTWKLKGYASSWANTAKNSGSNALGPMQPYIEQSVEKTYALASNGAAQGALLQTVTTDNTYDTYGNPTQIKVTTAGGGKNFQKITDNTYLASGLTSTYSQEKGRLSETTVTSKRDEDGNGSYELSSTRTSSFSYYTSGDLKGLLNTETIEPGNAALILTTTHSYDSFGNKVRAATTDASSNTRCDVNTADYDSLGRYVDSTYDCLGRDVSEVVSRNSFGEPLEVRTFIDATNPGAYVTNYYRYTARGIRYFEANSAGGWSATTLDPCNIWCPSGTEYVARKYSAGAGETGREYFDKLGRGQTAIAKSFDGSWVWSKTEYDNLGRVKRKSEPDFNSTPAHWTTLSYDILGRVTQTTLPDASTGSMTYNGYTTVTTNDLNHNKTEIKNALGETIQVTDHLGGDAYYHYDAQGNMISMVDDASNTSTITYDVLGRKTAMNDPDKGAWSYDYSGFGELISQTDAKGQESVMTYDTLGRMISRIDYTTGGELAGTIEGNTTWAYDTAPNGLGQLDAVDDSVSGYIKAIEYDSLGRVSKTTTSLGIAGVDGDHYEKVTYDQYGRTYQVFDAARNDDTYADNGIETRYNAYGYVHQLVDAVYLNGQTRSVYQEILSVDVRGNVLSEKLGNNVTTVKSWNAQTGRIASIKATTMGGVNGDIQDLAYQWDTVGNLSNRIEQSGNKDLTENFTYDGLNRLKTYNVVGGASKSINYDALGNITNKSDVGSYTYGSNAGPHAVTAAGGTTYLYDDNGNNTSSSDGRTITYTTFDKANSVSKGGHTTTFAYGADRSRYKRTDTKMGSVGTETQTTLYIGSVEKITKADGSKQIKRTIGGIAIETEEYNSSDLLTAQNTNYLYKDHLGSLDVITDATGQIASNGGEMSFDAWGQRRDAISWQDVNEAISIAGFGVFSNPITTRGFTGHEMVDEVGIIHMNGRIYDPKLGRFLQADPFVQSPTDTQMLNRYSYTRNNPLNATDPTGFIIPAIVGAILIALEVDLVITAIVVGVLAATQTLVMGGSFGDALIAGISAAAFAYVGGSFVNSGASIFGAEGAIFVAQMGVIGGITAQLTGGNFGNGFAAAGGAAFIGGALGGSEWFQEGHLITKIAAKAVVGGTLSKASGGKFANGAATSGFMVAFSSAVGSVFRPKVMITSPPDPTLQLDARLEQKMMTELSTNEAIDDGMTDEGSFPAYASRTISTVPEASSVYDVPASNTSISTLDSVTRSDTRTHEPLIDGASAGIDGLDLMRGQTQGQVYDLQLAAVGTMAGMVAVPLAAPYVLRAAGSRAGKEFLWEMGGNVLGELMQVPSGSGLPKYDPNIPKLPPAIVRVLR